MASTMKEFLTEALDDNMVNENMSAVVKIHGDLKREIDEAYFSMGTGNYKSAKKFATAAKSLMDKWHKSMMKVGK